MKTKVSTTWVNTVKGGWRGGLIKGGVESRGCGDRMCCKSVLIVCTDMTG